MEIRDEKFWMCVAIALLFILVNCYFTTRNFEGRINKVENQFNEILGDLGRK